MALPWRTARFREVKQRPSLITHHPFCDVRPLALVKVLMDEGWFHRFNWNYDYSNDPPSDLAGTLGIPIAGLCCMRQNAGDYWEITPPSPLSRTHRRKVGGNWRIYYETFHL